MMPKEFGKCVLIIPLAVKNDTNYYNYNENGYQDKTFCKVSITLISLVKSSLVVIQA